jgi:hypothetical protein
MTWREKIDSLRPGGVDYETDGFVGGFLPPERLGF